MGCHECPVCGLAVMSKYREIRGHDMHPECAKDVWVKFKARCRLIGVAVPNRKWWEGIVGKHGT